MLTVYHMYPLKCWNRCRSWRRSVRMQAFFYEVWVEKRQFHVYEILLRCKMIGKKIFFFKKKACIAVRMALLCNAWRRIFNAWQYCYAKTAWMVRECANNWSKLSFRLIKSNLYLLNAIRKTSRKITLTISRLIMWWTFINSRK